MLPQRHQLLDQALQLSMRMADLGAEGAWAEVVALESQRSELLQQAFEVPGSPDEAMTGKIQAILAADKRLMHFGATARDQVAAELAQMQRGRKVQQAYRDAGS
jgi:hypothetical protein